MKATCWMGRGVVELRDVPDPQLLNQRDAIVAVTSTAICGSDLHLYNGLVATMQPGDVLGHEFMGTVVEVGREVRNLRVGDRVVVPFTIACGNCWHCHQELWSLCENSNPNAWLAEKVMGHSASGAFGCSHLAGGFAGGQAEFVRVPFADVGPLKVDSTLPDEQLLFLSEVLPAGYMGAEMCTVSAGDTIAVWGCGSVGLFAIQSALLLGAGRVIAIDRLEYRLEMAKRLGAEVINYDEVTSVSEALIELTAGRGPDACIDAVGVQPHGQGLPRTVERITQATTPESNQTTALREAIMACRNGGTIAVIGLYTGVVDKFPLSTIMNRSLTIRSGQCHVHRYMRPLFDRIERREIDPSMVITHRLPLADVVRAYEMFHNKQDNCEKVVLTT